VEWANSCSQNDKEEKFGNGITHYEKKQKKTGGIMDIEKEITANSLAFVKENRGMKLDMENKRALNYISPRISSEFMDCSMPMTFDHYSHCSLGCTYCFAYMFKTSNISFSRKLHSVDPYKMIKSINGEPIGSRNKSLWKHFYSRRFLLHWGGLADPFCNFEKTNDIGYTIVEGLAKAKYPTLFSFKGSAVFRPKWVKLFDKYSRNKNFAFQVSIIAPTDEMSRKMEIGVPVTSQRIKAIKMLSDMGYFTILRLRPFVIGISDEGLDELLDQCLEAGIQAISMEFIAIDQRSNFGGGSGLRYQWLGKQIGAKDTLEYFKALSPSKRGGYLRLNRLVKEPYVKQVYKFCLENDIIFACSDPDYKELNMTGSCCGMPDDYPENREMENWSKNQLTYAVKELRKTYHQSGLMGRIKFDKVFRPDIDTYLKSKVMGQDHACVSQKTASERHGADYHRYAREVWNNLKSPGNPRNYMDGKVIPVMTDEHDNLVYIYEPTEYEDRWVKEGIDLKR
jgi:DNA repair photolyase